MKRQTESLRFQFEISLVGLIVPFNKPLDSLNITFSSMSQHKAFGRNRQTPFRNQIYNKKL